MPSAKNDLYGTYMSYCTVPGATAPEVQASQHCQGRYNDQREGDVLQSNEIHGRHKRVMRFGLYDLSISYHLWDREEFDTRRVDPAVPQDGHLHASRKEGRKEAQYAVVACRQTEIERLTDTSARLVKHPSVKVIALC